MNIEALNKEMGRTKVALMTHKQATFFSTIVLSMKTVWDDKQPTAYTNGRVIGWNPDFFMSLSREERLGVMVHEANHVAYDHMGRLKTRDRNVWNQAADHVINLDILSRGFVLPSFALKDERFRGMSAEEVYNVLIKEKESLPQNQMDDLRPVEGTNAEHEKHIKEVLLRAATIAKTKAGGKASIPGDILVMLEEMLNPRLPWHTILSRWMTAKSKTGYNWMKPNKRYFPAYHLPSRAGKGLKKIAIAFDASSSVVDYQFNIMVSEVAGVLKQFKPEEIRIIVFNTRIVSDNRVRNIRELKKIEFKGRGGTCCECVFDWAETNKPDALLVFTDGEFYFERDTLSVDTMWIINDNPTFQPRFGRAVFYETRK